MPNNCRIYGRRTKSEDIHITLHRFPKNPIIRKWLDGLNLTEDDITTESRICSMHFRDGNPKTIPSAHLGVKFASAPPSNTVRAKRCAFRTCESVNKK